jgi:hypothetical protein
MSIEWLPRRVGEVRTGLCQERLHHLQVWFKSIAANAVSGSGDVRNLRLRHELLK